MAFLRDPLWQFVIYVVVTLIVGIAGVITSILIFRKQHNRKEISYEILSDALIASLKNDFKGRIKISLDDTQVSNAGLLVLKVWNSGNVAVKPEDYYEPITFQLVGRTVHTVDVEPNSRIDPNDIKLLAPSSVELPKFFLNPKESINLTILLSGSPGETKGKATLIEGNLVEYRGDSREDIEHQGDVITLSLRRVISIIFGLLLNFVTIFLIFYILNLSSKQFEMITVIFVSFIATFFVSLYSIAATSGLNRKFKIYTLIDGVKYIVNIIKKTKVRW